MHLQPCGVRMCACDRYHETTVELGFNYRESFNTFVIQARKGDLPHPSAPSLKRCRLQLGWAAFSFYPNDRRNCAFGGEVPDFTSERTREDGFLHTRRLFGEMHQTTQAPQRQYPGALGFERWHCKQTSLRSCARRRYASPGNPSTRAFGFRHRNRCPRSDMGMALVLLAHPLFGI